MIGFSAPTADASGSMLLKEDKVRSRFNAPPTRASRSMCLDMTVHIEPGGVVDGDRTFRIYIPKVTRAERDFIEYLQANYTSALLSCSEGLFTGLIKLPAMSKGDLVITYWPSAKLDA